MFVDRCKKGVTLDLKHPRGKELFMEMVKKADVVVENFSAGTMDRLGLGWDVLRGKTPASSTRASVASATPGCGWTAGASTPPPRLPAATCGS